MNKSCAKALPDLLRIPSSAKRVGSTFADDTYSVASRLPPRGFLFSVCRWNKRTINDNFTQEIVKTRARFTKLKRALHCFFTGYECFDVKLV